ncbi:hypothetical protein ACSRUE_37485 [Sorangium sp. KYC3313]|uniref:hypothetical protein n=1 Tax=unclassified Sorangium TaxID=2621164 RepID=UPI003F63D12F
MTIAFAVLNDESLKGGDPTEDERLLLTLYETFRALQYAVTVHDEDRVRACVTKDIWTLTLPSGAGLNALLGALGRRTRDHDKAARLRRILVDSSSFDERGDTELTKPEQTVEVTFRDEQAPALRAAWLLRGLAWSADRAGWQVVPLPIKVRERAGDFRDEHLTNAFCANLAERHRAALALHVRVLPSYEDPGHHNPDRMEYQKYRHEKSQIPRHAERILRHALPTEGGMTWWARCACGFYHRYMGTLRGERVVVHWNGTTNQNATGNQPGKRQPTTDEEVPTEVKNELTRLRTLGESDCGCRELRGPGRE